MLRPAQLLSFALLAFPVVAAAETGLNPEIWFAHSVAVMGYDGSSAGDIYDSKIPLDDRTTISEIEDKFRKWGRFHLVTHPEDADIVVLVRKGSRIGIGGGGGQGGQRFPGGAIPEAGLVGDLFIVYAGRRADPLHGPPLWRSTEKDGLKSPQHKAFEKFKRQVEEAEKPPKP